MGLCSHDAAPTGCSFACYRSSRGRTGTPIGRIPAGKNSRKSADLDAVDAVDLNKSYQKRVYVKEADAKCVLCVQSLILLRKSELMARCPGFMPRQSWPPSRRSRPSHYRPD